MSLRDLFEIELVGSPPVGWTVGYMKIHGDGPQQVITEAWTKNAFAIHLTKDGRARLSHAPTGFGIGTFDTPDIAAECADEIAGFADWSKVKKQRNGGDLHKKVRPAIDRFQAMLGNVDHGNSKWRNGD